MEMSQLKTGHTVTAFDDEIAAIAVAINAMSKTACSALESALGALINGDTELGQKLIEQDDVLDEQEAELEKNVMRCIALRAPVADDLRYLVMAIRIGAMLERSGDHAKKIAKRVRQAPGADVAPLMRKLEEMNSLASSMLVQSVDCFNRGEAALAVVVRDRDVRLNALFDEFTVMVTRAMRANESFVDDGVKYLFIAKQLERVGDYAKIIAGSVHYIVTGLHLDD